MTQRLATTACPRLDVFMLHHNGALTSGAVSRWQWPQLVAEGWSASPAIPGSRDFPFLMQRPAPQTDSPEDQTA